MDEGEEEEIAEKCICVGGLCAAAVVKRCFPQCVCAGCLHSEQCKFAGSVSLLFFKMLCFVKDRVFR